MLLVVVSIALVLGAIYYAFNAQNKSAVAQSEQFAQSLLELEENRVKAAVKDWTWCLSGLHPPHLGLEAATRSVGFSGAVRTVPAAAISHSRIR